MDFHPLGTKPRLLTVNCIAIAVGKATAVPALGLDPQSSGFPELPGRGLYHNPKVQEGNSPSGELWPVSDRRGE